METPKYDVYLTGKLADGVAAPEAAQRLAQLFQSAPATMAGMLTGKPHLLKRGVDKATALKYREALLKAGVDVAFRAITTASAVEPTPAADTTPPARQLAAPGTDVLRPEERRTVTASAVDVSHLSLAEQGPLPATVRPEAVAPAIDHLSLAAAGSELLSAAERERPAVPTPDTGTLSLAPAGATIDMLARETTALDPDISQLSLAPAGSEVLTEEQRSKPAVAAPDTTHIQLAER